MLNKNHYNVIVIGGGPAGMAAGVSARENGAEDVLVIEREACLGGILNQCIHNGFGLHYFKQELTGPEYAERFINKLAESGVEAATSTMVLEIEEGRVVHAISPAYGYVCLTADAIVLAMGCRERTRGAVAIPGTRPSGVLTAGAAQHYMNIEGRSIGKRAVILGSGDIGLIMARRLTLEGADVLGVFELMPFSGGLSRNIVQCLDDYGIPLYLSHTITEIRGKDRVEQVVVQQVDESRLPVPGTERIIDCDTVLLSVGLIPENEISRQAGVEIDSKTKGPEVFENMETAIPGVFACGNVVHVHDLVDFVTLESIKAGKSAAEYSAAKNNHTARDFINIVNGEGIGYTVPQKVRIGTSVAPLEIMFRVNKVYKKSEILAIDQSGNIISCFKKPYMVPGEMEKIQITAEAADLLESKNITELTIVAKEVC